MTVDELKAALAAPFPDEDVQFRVGRVSKKMDSCTLLAYIDARAVAQRLDDVFGVLGWSDHYRVHEGGAECRLTILSAPHSCTKSGFGDWGERELAWKTGESDAFKRAAAKLGIGRYLYDLPQGWTDVVGGPSTWAKGRDLNVTHKGEHVGVARRPTLPGWALPASAPGKEGKPNAEPGAPVEEGSSSEPEDQAANVRRLEAFLDGQGWAWADMNEFFVWSGQPGLALEEPFSRAQARATLEVFMADASQPGKLRFQSLKVEGKL